MANIQETISEVEKLNPELARQIRKYVKDHAYGLVYEKNLPEAVRLYKKTVCVNDIVHILPPRGQLETAESFVPWLVKAIKDDVATLQHEDETKDVPVEDVVVIVSYRDVIYPGLKEIDRVERGAPDDPYHMVINAENYHALEALTYAYAGKVDCIYIDPPYNKPNAKDWKYNCDYINADDKYKHSKWLVFMERRLRLAKQLINPKDGVIILAIDDNEGARLTLLLEQLFPAYEIDTVIINHHPQGGADDNVSRTHEYALFVIPKGEKIARGERIDAMSESWSLMRGGTDVRNLRVGRPNSFYAIYVDKNTRQVIGVGPRLNANEKYSLKDCPKNCLVFYPVGRDGTERVWRYERTSMQQHIALGNIVCTDNMALNVVKHREVKYAPIFSVWTDSRYNAGTHGTSLLSMIFGDDTRFSYPKSLYSVKDCIKAFVQNKPNALIVDFFAGSGTTLHAVNLLNAEDGGHRRCICVTNNEVSESEEKKFAEMGLRPSDPDWEQCGIANYVTWPRTKCAIEGVNINGEPLSGNYLGTDIPMSDGFKSNAIFCELTYESAWPIRLDKAFDAIAPILWMQAGCRGPIIRRRGKSYVMTNYYGVLFDYNQASKFCDKVKTTPSIKTVFVVTDDQRRYSNMCRRLPGIEVHRLYETFLRTFEICGEGGLD